MAKRFRFPRVLFPILPIAPAIVVVVGITTAVVIAFLGIAQLQEKSDEASGQRAAALASMLAARLKASGEEDRAEILGRAARRSAAEIVLVDASGQVLVNESFGAPSRADMLRLLTTRSGEGRTALGRARFAVRPLSPPLDQLSVVAFVAAPHPPPGSIGLVNAVAALTALFLGMAVSVSFAYAKAARDDIDYVRRRIENMAGAGSDSVGEPIPIRALDQIGVLTAAFNVLVGRFSAAQRSYRADLRQAAEGARDRSVFLAGLSHELRTPLNAILGFTHVLASEVDGPLGVDAHEYLRVIKTSGEHLKAVIDDVLELSALESGKLVLSRRAVDLRRLAEQVVREASATARDKPVRLEVVGERGLMASADPRRLRRVLTNLITNAIRATSEGAVTVTVELRGGFIALIVKDTGAGIPASELSAIFKAYRQGGDPRTRSGGTGLGLTIAKRLVTMHGGTIEVESELGTGSMFTVCIPRSTEGDDMIDSIVTSRFDLAALAAAATTPTPPVLDTSVSPSEETSVVPAPPKEGA